MSQAELSGKPVKSGPSSTGDEAVQSGFWNIVRVSSGNFLEMYDFMVFGYFASAIGSAFFPGGNDFTKLLYALSTFGAGYLMRPVGAVVLGAYTDHHGRRAGLMLTLSLMAVGIASLTFMPTYAQIGISAPILVVAGRLLQGFSAGVELGSVSVYLAEVAPKGRKGFYVSWQSASQQVAVVVAALVGFVTGEILSPHAMQSWGWRIPLLVGCLIVPLLLVLRSGLKETEAFKTSKPPAMGEIAQTLARHWAPVLIGMGLATMTTVSFYTITAYTPTFGKLLHLTSRVSLLVTLCIGLSNLFWLPIMGAASDKVGRRPLLIGCTVLMALTAYPTLAWLATAPSFAHLLVVELWLSFLYASYNGAMVVYLTEIVPQSVRASGFSLAYSLATAVFGGFTPFISTQLIHVTSNRAMPGAWLALAAVLGLVATLFAGRLKRETN